jgi:hypothetical protein
MKHSRQEIVDLLRRAGLPEAADEAMAELTDPVDLRHVQEWCLRRGITRSVLISRMGGSPRRVAPRQR